MNLLAALVLAFSLNVAAIPPAPSAPTMDAPTRMQASRERIVVFNTKSRKYHDPACTWAKKCINCIKIPVSEAKKKGGVACKVCGG